MLGTIAEAEMEQVYKDDNLARILIVDGDPHLRQTLTRLCQQAGYEVLEASSGNEALRLAQEKQPDLILLDSVLSDLDGLTVCRRIKKDPDLENVFVLMMSGAEADSESQAEGLEEGADGYIARPVSNRELLARVEAMLRLKQAEDALRERVKELNCLYGISYLVDQPGITLDEILLGTVHLLPIAWRYPEVACSRITLDRLEFATKNYRETPWSLSQDLVVNGAPAGVVQIGYLKERPDCGNGGPFLDDERVLLRAIAERLGRIIERFRGQQALSLSEERYALAQRAATIGSWDWDIVADTLYWSEQAEPIFGFARGEFGATYEDFLACVHPDDRQGVLDAVNVCIQDGEDYGIEHRIVWPDGAIRWVSGMGDVVRDAEGRAIRMLGVVQDITDRKQVERALRRAMSDAEAARHEEEERRLEADRRRQIAESLGDVLTVLNSERDLDEVLDFIAVQARQLLGPQAAVIYRVEDGTGTLAIQAARGLIITYVSGTSIPLGREALDLAMASRRPVVVPDILAAPVHDEDLAQSKTWARIYRAMLAVPIVVQNEVYGSMLLYYTRPRPFSEEEVELATLFGDQVALALENAQLREQVRQAAASAERDRLARDLHDAVTQTLFSASLIAEAMPHIWERDPEEGRRGLQELRRLTKGAAAEMRTMLVELRPAFLREKPLGELLRHLADGITGRTRMPIDLRVEGNCFLPPDVQTTVYRIAQESLNNVAQHAHAGQVWVDLECQPARASLSVRDNGKGFSPAGVLPDRVGMGTMRERAESIGASLEITSRPGEGTHVLLQWQAGGE